MNMLWTHIVHVSSCNVHLSQTKVRKDKVWWCKLCCLIIVLKCLVIVTLCCIKQIIIIIQYESPQIDSIWWVVSRQQYPTGWYRAPFTCPGKKKLSIPNFVTWQEHDNLGFNQNVLVKKKQPKNYQENISKQFDRTWTWKALAIW